ncbi:MAG: heavy-metal-associated domain-containing protein [Thermodesulfobacteriota bacterium]
MSSILNDVDGVYRSRPNIVSQTVTVTFDPKTTSANELVALLKGKGFEVAGEPRFLK